MRLTELQKPWYLHSELARKFARKSWATRMQRVSPRFWLFTFSSIPQRGYSRRRFPRSGAIQTIFFASSLHHRDFWTTDAIPHSKRTDGETVTEIVLVESLNGPEKGTGKLLLAIFHSAKSPKLHSIPDCSTCSKFATVAANWCLKNPTNIPNDSHPLLAFRRQHMNIYT